VKVRLAIGLSLFVSLYCWPGVADPIRPGAGSPSDLTTCERCAACEKSGSIFPMREVTFNSQRAAQCKADCADCTIQSAAPTSVPGGPDQQTIEKQ
jgi:hypothetical protein